MEFKRNILALLASLLAVTALWADYDYAQGDCCGQDGYWENYWLYHDEAYPITIEEALSPCLPQEAQCGEMYGFWLPEDPVLFRPFVADPRQITYSVGWRFDDQALTKNIIDVSYADNLAFYRWVNVWPWCGVMQIELEGCLWACFDPCTESAPLINADYYVGVPLTYAIEDWQFRLRGYHISSHIGDEFLLNHPHFHRRNPSAEYLDFSVSHDITENIRLYGVLGGVVEEDKSYYIGRWYVWCGAEVRMPQFGFVSCKDLLYGEPYIGMHFRFGPRYKHHVDSTYVMGYEFGKRIGLQRRLRFFFEYHDGYSVEGQFSHIPTTYCSIRMSYGF